MVEPSASFDPYALLQALDRRRVSFIVIGGFARVLQGTSPCSSWRQITAN